MTRVKWTNYYTPNDMELDWYSGANWSEMDVQYKGNVIGTVKSFWGETYLVVACEDGAIREISIKKAQIC